MSGAATGAGNVNIRGTVAWTNGDTVPTVSNTGYEVTFTPLDTAHYKAMTAMVTPTVWVATLIIAWINNAQSVSYSGEVAKITPPTVTLLNGEKYTGEITYTYVQNGINRDTSNGLPTNAGGYTVTRRLRH